MSAAYIHNLAIQSVLKHPAHVCIRLQSLISLSAPQKQLHDGYIPYRISYNYRQPQPSIQTATITEKNR